MWAFHELLKVKSILFWPLKLGTKSFFYELLSKYRMGWQQDRPIFGVLMVLDSNAYLIVLRYGKIQSAKAILDKTTNKCKGQ